MAAFEWKRELYRRDHHVVLSGHPVAIHCHHYNINLQKTLEESLGEDGPRLIYQSAEAAAYDQLKSMLQQYRGIKTVQSKLEMFAIVYQNSGLGIIHPQIVENGTGTVSSPSSHHVTGWLAKHGRRHTPGCHFTCGWLAGALAAVFSRVPGTVAVKETQCKTMRHHECIFEVQER